MPLLTAVADVEEQASSFSEFLKSLTWDKVLPAAILLIVCLILTKILTTLFDKAIARSKIDRTLHPLLHSVFKTLLLILALLVVTGSLGVDVSVLVAILSVVSLAVSLAVQGTLSNIVGGLVPNAHSAHSGVELYLHSKHLAALAREFCERLRLGVGGNRNCRAVVEHERAFLLENGA